MRYILTWIETVISTYLYCDEELDLFSSAPSVHIDGMRGEWDEKRQGWVGFNMPHEGNSPLSLNIQIHLAADMLWTGEDGETDGWLDGEKCKSSLQTWLIMLIDEAEGQILSLHRGFLGLQMQSESGHTLTTSEIDNLCSVRLFEKKNSTMGHMCQISSLKTTRYDGRSTV